MLKRTPREVLASITITEFLAYIDLAADRAEEREDGEAEADLGEMDDTEIAATFGAKMVPRRGAKAHA